MDKFLVYSMCLILVQAHLLLVMANSEEELAMAEAQAPMAEARKLGKHIVLGKIAVSRLSPRAEAPKADENGEFSREVSASGEESGPVAQEEVMNINHHHHHRSVDKSVAGGGVILGGLATTFLVAVFCYIRATGRRTSVPGSPTNSDSSIERRRNGEPSSPVNS